MEEQSKSSEIANWVLGAAGLGAVSSVGVAVTMRNQAGLIIACVLLLLLVLLIGGYLLWQKLKRQRASTRFESSLNQEASRAPHEIKDPNRQAELDKLRKRFLQGIEVYRSRGKDVYSVPWFVIIGESGSGKTEAIRHSNLDFPPGLNDFMQGAGGTINMDWWFTNHGVILDTAGSLVFREMGADSGASPQWQEFLKLLKKHRPHCPINGLILVLSVDSLISDSAATISQKAGRIARQLDLIQRSLDVRFPVSLLVTKCDKLTGFREFFDHIDDPELQDQMVGWSNPEPLDVPFRPDLVDQYLEQVLQRLRKRRAGLLRDPQASKGPRARRADEVDALYAVPKSLSLIAPRLRRYLETIFVAGEFSAKPVFLRGIYFTSAMQTGTDLDEAVWAALGRPPELMTETSAGGDVGRPFFLRHVFLEKVFRERGLVTRATNTRAMLRNRKLALISVTSGCLLLLLLFAATSYFHLKASIRDQLDAWKVAAADANWTASQRWHPVVEKAGPNPPGYQYRGSDKVGDSEKVVYAELAKFHHKLRGYAETDLRPGLVFLPIKWIGKVSTSIRQRAQRLVFERSVVLPPIEDTREKMMRETPADGGAAGAEDPGRQTDALKALIRLEVDLVQGKRAVEVAKASESASLCLLPYLYYLTGKNKLPATDELVDVLLRTYSMTNKSRSEWPPASLGGGNTLAANTAIRAGLRLFLANAERRNTVLGKQLETLDNVSAAVKVFKDQEEAWHLAADGKAGLDKFVELDFPLQRAKAELDKALETGAKDGLLKEDRGWLATNITRWQVDSSLAGRQAVAQIQEVVPKTLTNQLFVEIGKELDAFSARVGSQLKQRFGSSNEVADLDARFLNRLPKPASWPRAYEFRFQIYTQAVSLQRLPAPKINEEIGKRWRFFAELGNRTLKLTSDSDADPGGYQHQLVKTRDHLLRLSTNLLGASFINNYVQFVNTSLTETDGLPRSQISLATLAERNAFFTNVQADLDSLASVPAEYRGRPAQLQGTLDKSRLGLITKFAEARRAELDERLGFPVLRDPPTGGGVRELQPQEVKELCPVVASLNNSLASPAVTSYPAEPTAHLAARVRQVSDLLSALLDTNNNVFASYKIKVDPNDKENVPTFRKLQGMAVSTNEGARAEWMMNTPVTFGPFSVDQPLVIVLKKISDLPPERPQPAVGTHKLDRWAALRMMTDARYDARPDLGGAEPNTWTWTVKVPVGDAAGGSVKVGLVFRQRWPAPTEWPSK
jgi:hypothetical protein